MLIAWPGWCQTQPPPGPEEQPARFAAHPEVTGQTTREGGPGQSKPRNRAVVERTCASGDCVNVRIQMQPAFRAIDRQQPNRAALTYGPVLLGRLEGPLPVKNKVDPGNRLMHEEAGPEFWARQ